MRREVYLIISGIMLFSLMIPIQPWTSFGPIHLYAQESQPTIGETGVTLGNYTELVHVQDTVDQVNAKEQYLQAIRKVRTEAYENNFPFNGRPLRDVLSDMGINSAEAYADLVKWDKGLEMIAIQRAYETEVHNMLAHIRATGQSAFNATYQGKSMSSENISWGRTAYGGTYNGWYKEEVGALKTANGEWNTSDGHLHTLLNPSYTYHGVGITSHNTLVGAYRSNPIETGQSNWTGTKTITVGVKSFTNSQSGKSATITTSNPIHKTETGTMPEPVYEDTTDLLEGETQTKTEGKAGQTEYDLVEKTFNGAGETTKYTGAPRSYTIGQTKDNVQTTEGVAPVILRGTARKVVENEAIAYETIREADHTAYVNDGDKIITEGVDGNKQLTYKVYQKDGKEVKELLSTEVTKTPINKVVRYGTLAKKTTTQSVELPYETQYVKDSSLKKGESEVRQVGQKGSKTITYEVTYDTEKDSEEVSRREIGSEITKEPVPEIIAVGSLEKVELEAYQDLDFNTVEKESDELYVGETKTIPGQKGQKKLTYEVTYVDGQETERKLIKEEVISEPTDEILLKGTKKRPVTLMESGSTILNNTKLEKDSSVVLHIDASPSSLIKLLLDDEQLVLDEDYTVHEGSTIITLTANRLNQLSLGTHTLKAIFGSDASHEAGEITTTFEIVEPAKEKPAPTETKVVKRESKTETNKKGPATSYAPTTLLWLSLAGVSLILIRRLRKLS